VAQSCSDLVAGWNSKEEENFERLVENFMTSPLAGTTEYEILAFHRQKQMTYVSSLMF